MDTNSKLSAARWIVLDNLVNRWPYRTNLDQKVADESYLWCIRNEYIKDGAITASGRGALIANMLT